MSPGFTVSPSPVVALVDVPCTAQRGPGKRGNSTNSATISGSDCSSSRPASAPVERKSSSGPRRLSCSEPDRREPDEQQQVEPR